MACTRYELFSDAFFTSWLDYLTVITVWAIPAIPTHSEHEEWVATTLDRLVYSHPDSQRIDYHDPQDQCVYFGFHHSAPPTSLISTLLTINRGTRNLVGRLLHATPWTHTWTVPSSYSPVERWEWREEHRYLLSVDHTP